MVRFWQYGQKANFSPFFVVGRPKNVEESSGFSCYGWNPILMAIHVLYSCVQRSSSQLRARARRRKSTRALHSRAFSGTFEVRSTEAISSETGLLSPLWTQFRIAPLLPISLPKAIVGKIERTKNLLGLFYILLLTCVYSVTLRYNRLIFCQNTVRIKSFRNRFCNFTAKYSSYLNFRANRY